jgi:hypothetical protein
MAGPTAAGRTYRVGRAYRFAAVRRGRHTALGRRAAVGGTCQRTWQHAGPKVAHADLRISVQFRSAQVDAERS